MFRFATERSYDTLSFAERLKRLRPKPAAAPSTLAPLPTVAPPTPPTSVIGTASEPCDQPHREPPTRTKALFTSEPRIVPVQGPSRQVPRSSPCPRPTQTTRHRPQTQPPSSHSLNQRKRAADTPTQERPNKRPSSIVEKAACRICGTNLQVRRCRDCPGGLYLCARCIVRVPLAHPFLDHRFVDQTFETMGAEAGREERSTGAYGRTTIGEEETPGTIQGTSICGEEQHRGMGAARVTRAAIRAAGSTPALARTPPVSERTLSDSEILPLPLSLIESSAAVRESDSEPSTTPSTSIPSPRCGFCNTDLLALYYKCEDCSETLCSGHSSLHFNLHTLRTVDGPPACSGSEEAEHSGMSQLGEAHVGGAEVDQIVVDPDVDSDTEGPILLGSPVTGSLSSSPPAMVFRTSSSPRMPSSASLATSPSLFSEGAKDRNDSIDISQDSASEDDNNIAGEDVDDCESIVDNMGLDMGGDDEDEDEDEDALPEVSKEHMVSAALNKVLALSSALNQAIEELKDITGPQQTQNIGRTKRAILSKARAGLDFNLLADNDRPMRLGRSSRQWGPRDRQLLARMKQKGHSDEQIAARLDRSVGAVAQQWRKQRLSRG